MWCESRPRITGHQAETGRGNGGAKTEFSDGAGKSERKLELWESKSKMLENEIRLLKTPVQHPAQRKAAANRARVTNDNEQVDEQVDEQGDVAFHFLE